jgi:hypothetical protein
VIVRVDEPGQNDHALSVDDLSRNVRQVGAHIDDGAVAHMDVAARQDADVGVDGEDDATP